jgi:hypothetical protein
MILKLDSISCPYSICYPGHHILLRSAYLVQISTSVSQQASQPASQATSSNSGSSMTSRKAAAPQRYAAHPPPPCLSGGRIHPKKEDDDSDSPHRRPLRPVSAVRPSAISSRRAKGEERSVARVSFPAPMLDGENYLDDLDQLDDLFSIDVEETRLLELQVDVTRRLKRLSNRRMRVVMADEKESGRRERMSQRDERTVVPRAAKRPKKNEQASQHGYSSGTTSASRPAAQAHRSRVLYWITIDEYPQPVCCVDGNEVADTCLLLLSRASDLLNFYKKDDVEELIQTDLQYDKAILDAIGVAGIPEFSYMVELGEHKGIGIATCILKRKRAAMLALAITVAPHQGALPQWLQPLDAEWSRLTQAASA